ncbi:glycosyltransferase [Candidatus Microgenomates bacterium]|nr:glycosyltransferase [Candidatus Microgenomates bacterium]
MISVVVPAYKNTTMLLNNLKHNLKYLKGAEIIIVNDDPAASIQSELKHLPLTLIENQQNLGFAGAVNVGFSHAKGQFVLLLNSDVLLHDDSWKKALERMEHNEHYFAISFAQREADGSIVGKNTIYWNNGFFLHKKAADMHAGPTGWAEGGSCLINKKTFNMLGGFDEIYTPFYWEDIDLSYRAWKAGYTVYFDPAVLVEHHHESTIGKYFKKKRIERIAQRNQFIFIWKNIDSTFLAGHFSRLALFLAVTIVNPVTTVGFLSALLRLPAIMHKRQTQRALYKLSDSAVLEKFQ